MTNDNMFTTKDGKRIPVPSITLPESVVTSAMRLQEDYAAKGKRYKLVHVIIEMLSVGKDTIERRWAQAEKNKDLRETGKNVKEYIRVQLALRKPIDPSVIAELSGMSLTAEIDSESLDGEATDLTLEQLEEATSPTGLAS